METKAPPGGRPSAIQPQMKLERRISSFFATIFYGFLFLAAWVWLEKGMRIPLASLWRQADWARDLALGLGAGLCIAWGSVLVAGRLHAARELEREFGWILGEQRGWEIVLLAAASGVAEEMFFRGALLAAIGPIPALIIFAALHWPVNGAFRLWPVTALLAGGVLTVERLWTGGVLAPAVTHAVVNGVNLVRITRKYRVWKETA